MTKISKPKAAPKRTLKQAAAGPDGFYCQGLGPGYSEEEFGPGDKARTKPDEPASIRNFRGDRYSRFDRPGRKNPGITRER